MFDAEPDGKSHRWTPSAKPQVCKRCFLMWPWCPVVSADHLRHVGHCLTVCSEVAAVQLCVIRCDHHKNGDGCIGQAQDEASDVAFFVLLPLQKMIGNLSLCGNGMMLVQILFWS